MITSSPFFAIHTIKNLVNSPIVTDLPRVLSGFGSIAGLVHLHIEKPVEQQHRDPYVWRLVKIATLITALSTPPLSPVLLLGASFLFSETRLVQWIQDGNKALDNPWSPNHLATITCFVLNLLALVAVLNENKEKEDLSASEKSVKWVCAWNVITSPVTWHIVCLALQMPLGKPLYT